MEQDQWLFMKLEHLFFAIWEDFVDAIIWATATCLLPFIVFILLLLFHCWWWCCSYLYFWEIPCTQNISLTGRHDLLLYTFPYIFAILTFLTNLALPLWLTPYNIVSPGSLKPNHTDCEHCFLNSMCYQCMCSLRCYYSLIQPHNFCTWLVSISWLFSTWVQLLNFPFFLKFFFFILLFIPIG